MTHGPGAGAAGAACAVSRAVEGAVSRPAGGGVGQLVASGAVGDLHLPRRLHARRGVGSVERDLAQVVVLEDRHLALPDVEVDDVADGGGEGHGLAAEGGAIEEGLCVRNASAALPCTRPSTSSRSVIVRSPKHSARMPSTYARPTPIVGAASVHADLESRSASSSASRPGRRCRTCRARPRRSRISSNSLKSESRLTRPCCLWTPLKPLIGSKVEPGVVAAHGLLLASGRRR